MSSIQETMSINQLKKMCAQTNRIDTDDVKSGDKAPIWDGNLVIFDNDKRKKNGNEYKVPIQVKGRLKENYFKNQDTYALEMVDLKAYKNNGGCLFFLGQYDGISETTLYYKRLLPMDIDMLFNAKTKIQKTYSFKVEKINSYEELMIAIEYFRTNQIKQSNALVYANSDVTSAILDFDHLQLSGIYQNEVKYNDIFDNDGYIYAVKNGNYYPFYGQFVSLSHEGYFKISINEEVIGNYQGVVHQEKDRLVLVILNGLELVTSPSFGTSINFKIENHSKVKEIYEILKIFIGIFKYKKIKVDGNQIDIDSDIEKEKDFFECANYIVERVSLLIKLNIDIDGLNIKDILEANKLFRYLIEAQKTDGLKLYEKADVIKYLGELGEKKLLLLFKKQKNGRYIMNLPLQCKAEDRIILRLDNNDQKEVPIFTTLKNPCDFIYDTKIVENDLLNCYTVELANYYSNFVLEIIKGYDIYKNSKYIELAQFILSLIKKDINEDIWVINYMQCKYRVSKLNHDDKKRLTIIKLNSTELGIKCGAAILLDLPIEAGYFIKQMDSDEKHLFESFPIYQLYQQ